MGPTIVGKPGKGILREANEHPGASQPGPGGPAGTEVLTQFPDLWNCAGASLNILLDVYWPYLGDHGDWKKALSHVPTGWVHIECATQDTTRCHCPEPPEATDKGPPEEPQRSEREIILWLIRWKKPTPDGKEDYWHLNFHMMSRSACGPSSNWVTKVGPGPLVVGVTDPDAHKRKYYERTGDQVDREDVMLCYCATSTKLSSFTVQHG